MQPYDNIRLIQNFYDFTNPIPLLTSFSQQEVRNNDMKISLEIATRSYLRMQSDPKSNLISFSCKVHGKNCYQIFGIKENNKYLVKTNYSKVTHRKNCQLKNQEFQYLKIYNLMKIKKNGIESYMMKHDLMNSSPSQILSHISSSICQPDEYFFQKRINYLPQLRRKLRKRFDNIINIDIKKITKEGRRHSDKEIKRIDNRRKKQQEKQNNKANNQSGKQQKRSQSEQKQIKQEIFDSSICLKDKEDQIYQPQQTSVFNEEKCNKNNKSKTKNISKNKKPSKSNVKYFSKINKQKKQKQKIIQNGLQSQQQGQINVLEHNRLSQSNLKQQVFINPLSQNQLQQIKQLNSGFNGFQNMFLWDQDDPYQPVFLQTINDKLRQNVFLSLRNSLLKRSVQTKSLQNISVPLPNFPNYNDFNEDDEAI